MAKAMYLINPACDFPTYFGAEVYAANGFRPVTLMADLAVVTLAAMAASDFEVRLCDENISPVDFDCAADWVGITGKITQWGHMRNIAREFRRRGKIVVIGGPYASLCPAVVRPYCDILVRGEVEDIAEELFSDLRDGGWKTEYVGSCQLRVSSVLGWLALIMVLVPGSGCYRNLKTQNPPQEKNGPTGYQCDSK